MIQCNLGAISVPLSSFQHMSKTSLHFNPQIQPFKPLSTLLSPGSKSLNSQQLLSTTVGCLTLTSPFPTIQLPQIFVSHVFCTASLCHTYTQIILHTSSNVNKLRKQTIYSTHNLSLPTQTAHAYTVSIYQFLNHTKCIKCCRPTKKCFINKMQYYCGYILICHFNRNNFTPACSCSLNKSKQPIMHKIMQIQVEFKFTSKIKMGEKCDFSDSVGQFSE